MQRDHLVHVRIGIYIVQAHPDPEFAQAFSQFVHAGFQRTTVPESGAVFNVHAIGAGVLRDDQQFLHAGPHQALGLPITSPMGRLTRSPRSRGMMQKLQR